jgi:hypothetical protein
VRRYQRRYGIDRSLLDPGLRNSRATRICMVYCVAASALMPRSQLCAPICGSVSGLYRDPGAVRSLLREGSDMRFAFIAKRRAVWPVAWLCEALDVSRPGFHAWLNRSPSARSRRDEVLVTAIDGSFKSSDRTYGARRVWHDMLAEGRSWSASHRAAHASEPVACPAAPPRTADRHRRASRSVGPQSI